MKRAMREIFQFLAFTNQSNLRTRKEARRRHSTTSSSEIIIFLKLEYFREMKKNKMIFEKK
jgi:hypothetical protein